MSESYVECMVARKTKPIESFVKYVLYGLTGFAILGALFTSILVFFIAAIALGVGSYFFSLYTDIEYEYLYLDKEITIDKVIAKQKRKRAISLDVNKAEVIAPTNSHELDSYRNRQHVDKDYSSGIDGAKTFTMVYSDKEQLMLIKFEPNSEMLSAIKTVFPRKVVEY